MIAWTSVFTALSLGAFGGSILLWFRDHENWRNTGAQIHIAILVLLTAWAQQHGWLAND